MQSCLDFYSKIKIIDKKFFYKKDIKEYTMIMYNNMVRTSEEQKYFMQRGRARFSNPEEEEKYSKTQSKKCSKCKLDKDLTQYGKNMSGQCAFTPDGLRRRRPECKDCLSKITSQKQKLKMSKIPEGSTCEICKTDKKIVNDHSHIGDGRARGYLCDGCNRGLGLLGDTSEWLTLAWNYVNKYENRDFSNEDGILVLT